MFCFVIILAITLLQARFLAGRDWAGPMKTLRLICSSSYTAYCSPGLPSSVAVLLDARHLVQGAGGDVPPCRRMDPDP